MLKVKDQRVLTMENIIIYELKILKDLNKNALMFLYSFKISYLHYQFDTILFYFNTTVYKRNVGCIDPRLVLSLTIITVCYYSNKITIFLPIPLFSSNNFNCFNVLIVFNYSVSLYI